ncbi:MAG: hypothetical protein AB3N64_13260 [Puniceicoccaceae bacterium]
MHAELIAYEGFDYTAGTILGPNDLIGEGELGNGWEGVWIRSRNSTPSGYAPLQDGSLSYTDAYGSTLITSGNHVLVSGQTMTEGGQNTTVGRDLAGLESTPGSVYYISFIAQRLGDPVDMSNAYWDTLDPPGYIYGTNAYPRAAGVRFLPDAGNNKLSALVGRFSNQPTGVWTLAGEALTGDNDIESDVPLTETSFIVVRIEYFDGGPGVDSGGNPIDVIGTTVSLWVNPENLKIETAPVGTATPVDEDLGDQPVLWGIDGIGIEGNNESVTPEGFVTRAVSKIAVDELRIGTTWDDVTPSEGGSSPMWAHYPIQPDGSSVDTGGLVGWIDYSGSDFVFSYSLGKYIYMPQAYVSTLGAWFFILGESTPQSGESLWAGYSKDAEGYVDTMGLLGWIWVGPQGYIYSFDLGKYIYLPEEFVISSGAWAYAGVE